MPENVLKGRKEICKSIQDDGNERCEEIKYLLHILYVNKKKKICLKKAKLKKGQKKIC